MKKSRSKFLKIVYEKHDINFHWPYCCLLVVVVEMSDDHVPYIAIQTDTVENNDKFKSGHLLHADKSS
jgi:hypothetical protein